MIRKVLFTAAMFALIVGALTTPALAAERLATVEIPFAFTVDGTSMPAGTYILLADGATGGTVTLRNGRSGAVASPTIVTRLADLGLKEPKLVFDASGDAKYLSEIHVPGRDGYALKGAAVEHSHELVSGAE